MLLTPHFGQTWRDIRRRLTTRAQARGTNQRKPRSGTKASNPRCLQRFVRPRPDMCKAILDGIKPPIAADVKKLVMEWVASENTETLCRDPNIEPGQQPPKQAP